ncbi:Tex family protein [Metabacillus lacus]
METQERILRQIEKELSITYKKISNVISLLGEGNTVPFIARYRKEQTGALDEVQIKDIEDKWVYMQNLESRKEEVLRLIEEQGKLTEELKRDIVSALKLQQVEDLYRPYKQKRRTRATAAKEKGLEPLALWIQEEPAKGSLRAKAAGFVDPEKGVETEEAAIAGALDIIAESISDNPQYRQWIRAFTMKNGTISAKLKDKGKDEKAVYEMYYEYEERISKVVPHRVLALNRGEKEDVLRVTIGADTAKITSHLSAKELKNPQSIVKDVMGAAIEDAYKRLIQPSIEREIRNELTETAEDRAIHIFSENLRKLLLQPPLKGKIVLGVDPAYRTGCKLAAINETGRVLEIGVMYPHPPVKKAAEAKKMLQNLIEKYDVELIAIGNGTASRETEQFVVETIKETKRDLAYIIVNEAGASVYSASQIAREEFPDFQVEERSAVSIARRLQDPLAELVKIDPKSVGVGQYQHDVSQKKLNDSLSFVVETAVNHVGVNANTASSALLQYVAGLSKTVASNIVKAREEKGRFQNRSELKKIPRLGAKTYEQCIGFLRITDGDQPLDSTGIHPESYPEVKKLLKQLGFSLEQIGSEELRQAIGSLNLKETAASLQIGELTLKDIADALVKPGRDPRDEVAAPLLKKDVLQLEDLKEGMELQGTVRNVVDFGAFVDIGVKQDGLVHISKLSTRFVKHPLDIVSVGDVVTVWVDGIDANKGRVALSMVKE